MHEEKDESDAQTKYGGSIDGDGQIISVLGLFQKRFSFPTRFITLHFNT